MEALRRIAEHRDARHLDVSALDVVQHLKERSALRQKRAEQLRRAEQVGGLNAEAVELAFVERELRSMTLLAGLDPTTLQAVVPMFEVLEVRRPDEAVFEEGDPGDSFYILASGRVAIVKGGVTLAELHPGRGDGRKGGAREDCFFGEMALIDGQPRMAGAHTLGPVKMLVLKGYMFRAFLDRVPDFEERLESEKQRRALQAEEMMHLEARDEEEAEQHGAWFSRVAQIWAARKAKGS